MCGMLKLKYIFIHIQLVGSLTEEFFDLQKQNIAKRTIKTCQSNFSLEDESVRQSIGT